MPWASGASSSPTKPSPRPTRTFRPVATETELKLRIAPDAAAGLARHPALRALKRDRARTTRLASTYFDTDDDDLLRAGVTLRLRRSGRRWLQTVKGAATEAARPGAPERLGEGDRPRASRRRGPESAPPHAGTQAGLLTARPEFEWPVAGPDLDPLRFIATPFRGILGKAERAGLAARFTTDIARTTIPLRFPDGTMAELCIDVGEIRTADGGPPRSVAVHEIEIELEAGDPLRILELAYTLAGDVPLAIETATKAARGYALRHPHSPIPQRADDVVLSHKATAGHAIAAILRSCLAQVEGNASGVLADDDPEWIHQMRIGVRRLRACLSLAAGSVATARIEPLRVELRWLAQALGPARDLDVFVQETLPAFRDAVVRGSHAAGLAPAIGSLGARAVVHRREARLAARAAVASPRLVRIVLAATALAATLDAGGMPGDDARKLTRPARNFARPLLRKRHEALQALGTDLAHAAPEARHAARLAAKKLRYATEFFARLYGRKRTRRYRKALAILQEELGAWNDAAVAARLAASLAGPQSPAAAAFAGWAAARGASRTDALTQAWVAFCEARPFWARDR